MTVLMRPDLTSAYADLIPETAADRDAVFFFGTLMHDEVLARVLDRSVAGHETAPAQLAGFRRERAASASYPVLVEDPEADVEGRLLHRPSRRDILRINHFEDDEYRAHRLTVETDGIHIDAWVFLAHDDVAMMQPSGETWHLNHWAARHLDAYRAEIDGWMANSPC